MSELPEMPKGLFPRDTQGLFDRARSTAVELARLILTLATGTIGALSLAVMHVSPVPFPEPHITFLRCALISLVLTVALALVGIASDALSDSTWALSLRHDEDKTGRWYKRHGVWRILRKTIFALSAVAFVIGIASAGMLILALADKPIKIG
jgi:hypothetical protein